MSPTQSWYRRQKVMLGMAAATGPLLLSGAQTTCLGGPSTP